MLLNLITFQINLDADHWSAGLSENNLPSQCLVIRGCDRETAIIHPRPTMYLGAPMYLGVFDKSIMHIDYRYVYTCWRYWYQKDNLDIDIDIAIDTDIDRAILENIDIVTSWK